MVFSAFLWPRFNVEILSDARFGESTQFINPYLTFMHSSGSINFAAFLVVVVESQ